MKNVLIPNPEISSDIINKMSNTGLYRDLAAIVVMEWEGKIEKIGEFEGTWKKNIDGDGSG